MTFRLKRHPQLNMKVQKKHDKALAMLERPTGNTPLVISAGVEILLALGAAIASFSSSDWIAGIFAFSACLAGVSVLLFYYGNEKRRHAAADRGLIKWDSALPEVQRQSVNLEVRELASQLGVDNEHLSDLLSAFIVAEDLALRQIQQEEKLPMLRHVEVGTTPFDAVMIDQDSITCIEVSFLVAPDIRQDKIESIIKKIASTSKSLHDMKLRLRVNLMLVLVTQLSAQEEDLLRGHLVSRRFSETPVDIDIRMLDFEMLQRVYINEKD